MRANSSRRSPCFSNARNRVCVQGGEAQVISVFRTKLGKHRELNVFLYIYMLGEALSYSQRYCASGLKQGEEVNTREREHVPAGTGALISSNARVGS